MNKILAKFFLALSLALIAAGFTGCFNANEDDSEIPWTRPQSWENNAPGMGGRGSTF